VHYIGRLVVCAGRYGWSESREDAVARGASSATAKQKERRCDSFVGFECGLFSPTFATFALALTIERKLSLPTTERIPPVPKNVQTLYKQGQRMPVQRAQSTASPAPIDRLKEKSVQRSGNACQHANILLAHRRLVHDFFFSECKMSSHCTHSGTIIYSLCS
jgi:hypothetical protein